MVRCHTPEQREDRRPLLINGSDVTARGPRDDVTSYDSVQDDGSRLVDVPTKKQERSVELAPFIILNVVNFLFSCSGRFSYLDQYLYKFYAGPYAGNTSINTGSNPCFEQNDTNVTSPEVDIQKQASEMLLYLDLTKSILATFSVFTLGALTVVLNRRLLIIIPLVGQLTKCTVIGVVAYFELHVNWLFIGYTVDGLMASEVGFYFGLMVYLSEITSRTKSRTFAITFLQCSQGAITTSIDILKGHLIQYSGYTLPAALSTSLMVASLLVALFLPARRPEFESASEKLGKHTSLMGRFWDRLMIPFVDKDSNGATSIIMLAGLTYFFGTLGMMAFSQSFTLYLMNRPFCWSSFHLGWFFAADSFADDIFNIIVIGLFTKFLPGGVTLAVPAILIAGAGKVMYGGATSDLGLYMGAVLGLAGSIPSLLIRGETSRVLGPKAQGPWFAVIAVIESACFALGTPAIALYRWSLDISLSGLVFYVAAGFYLMKGVTLVFYQVQWRRYAALQSLEDAAPPADSCEK